MAYFEDLSEYEYFAEDRRPRSRNIGWLEQGHSFDVLIPSDETLKALWEFCKVAVMQSRGLHDCDLCGPEHRSFFAARAGEKIWLGSAEIRVFSSTGRIYAAPNLIYHYIRVHHYKPPEEFQRALNDGPYPPSQTYFDRLQSTGFKWRGVSTPPAEPRAGKSVPIDGKPQMIWRPALVHLDED